MTGSGKARRKGGTGRQKCNSKRARVDTGSIYNMEKITQNLDIYKPSVQRLVKASFDRKCYLSVMPPGMSRRERNNSRYITKSDTILWRVQLVFVAQAGAANNPSDLLQDSLDTVDERDISNIRGLVGLSREAVDEKITIRELLLPLIDQIGDGNVEFEAQRHALRYIRQNRVEVKCLLQKIPSPSASPVFMDVPESLSLVKALEEKRTLEYPVFFVGLSKDVAHLQRHIEEMSEGEGNVKSVEQDEEEQEDSGESSAEEGGIDAVMEALQEMEGKPIQDLQRIIEEQASQASQGKVAQPE